MLYGLQSVMHDQAMYHAWLLSVHHAANCQTSCSQLHYSSSQYSQSEGERHHYFNDVFFLCMLSSTEKELYSCTEQARVLFWFMDIGQLTKIEIGENQVWPINMNDA